MMASDVGGQHLERTSSQTSNASRRSGTVRTKPRKQSLVTPTSAKTLESFPSLSPEASPGAKQFPLAHADPKTKTQSEDDKTPRKPTKLGPSKVDILVKSSPSFRGRAALFDDTFTSSSNEVPGGLHHASDEHIQSLIGKKGAITLVRQLALDLADRDAEIVVFRRRAEERERELKRMLREVEVSNMDIEKRLHRLEGPEDSLTNRISPTEPVFSTDGSREKASNRSGEISGLDKMMGEAMKDGLGLVEIDEGYLDSLADSNKQATIRARSVFSKESDAKSVTSSTDSQNRRNGTVRAWKDYLWSNNATDSRTSRASSVTDEQGVEEPTLLERRHTGSNGRRQGIPNELFIPPDAMPPSSTPTRQPRKSSSSIASWTTKLFAGNNQVSRDTEAVGPKRSRASSTGSQSQRVRGTSKASNHVPPVPPIPQSAKDALMKVSTGDSSKTLRAGQAPKAGAGSQAKLSAPQPTNAVPISPAITDNASNLGPVEMDTIHPPESKPPTLSQLHERSVSSNNLLTDRFGFIYDQRRRKKEAEMPVSHKRGKSSASANLEMIKGTRESLKSKSGGKDSTTARPESITRPDTPMSSEERLDEKPTKRWQDYLKVATFPTELLSHTPIVQPSTTVISPDPSITPMKRTMTADLIASLPALSPNPEPEMTPLTVSNADITMSPTNQAASPSIKATDNEPVRLLLAQLTELHDTIQKERTIKWNEFLRKVRAERKKEGENAVTNESRLKSVATPEVMLTDGEVIGVAGLGNKGKVGRAKWKEFKTMVLGGIPVAYRAKIWAECSGASALRVPGYYDDLVANSHKDDPIILAQIQMDINRTLTDNVFFRHGPGVHKLNEVLIAYSRRNPDVGYCQGMNLIAASLLLIMPTAEDAFWLLTSLVENTLPQHYYDQSLLASRADQQVLRQYVAEILPRLSAHLDELGIELEALTFQWFLSVFTDCLSAEALFRVWDVVLCFNDGSTFLFQVALALLKLNETALLACDTPAQIYSYIGNEMTDHAISIDGLIGASEALKNVVLRQEVEDRRLAAVEQQRGDATSRSRGESGSSNGAATNGNVDGGDLQVQEPIPFEG